MSYADPSTDPAQVAARGRLATSWRSAVRRVGTTRLFLLPTVGVLLALSLYPFLYNVWHSLHGSDLVGNEEFVGLGNFRDLLSDDRFWAAMAHTLQFTAITVTATTVLGLALAKALNTVIERYRRIWLPVVVIPMAMSPLIVGLIFRFLYSDTVGPVNYYLSQVGIGLDSSVLSQSSTALWAAASIDVWQWTPFAVLVFLAGLQSIPRNPIDAARIDGASRWDVFRLIELPLIRTEIIVVILLRMLDSWRVFDVIFAATRGGPGTQTETVSLYLQKQAFSFLETGYASAMALIVMFIAVFACMPLARRIQQAA